MKILLWQTAYLGDVVLTTPLIRTIKKNMPDSILAFVGRPFVTELLRGYDIQTIPFDKSLRQSFSMPKVLKDYHVAISPHVSMRTALILFFSRIPVRIGFDRSELSWLYTHRVQHRWHMHEVDRNLQLLSPLGVEEYERMPLLYVEDREKELVSSRFNLPKEFVVLSPFSNFTLKEWHLSGWLELVSRLPLPAVVVGTGRDMNRARVFDRKGVWNLVGKTSLRELMAVISLSRAVISCDSSPVHIANALQIPAISLYTATSPDYGFYPLIGKYLTPDLPCSPCSPNPRRCKTGTQACLRRIGVDEVLVGFETLLSAKLMTD